MLEIQKHTNELFQRGKQQSERDGYSCFYRDSLMSHGGNWETEKDGKLFGTFLRVNSFSPVRTAEFIFTRKSNENYFQSSSKQGKTCEAVRTGIN